MTLRHGVEAAGFEAAALNLQQERTCLLYASGAWACGHRLRFLRSFAIYLQRPGHTFFAPPQEIRDLVETLFKKYLQSSNTPQQLLENYYRTCRRHSGLTTEGQFLDTSGNIDTPVDEMDIESRVGFSHNSLREYLVADAIADHLLKGTEYPNLYSATITSVVGDLLVEIAAYEPDLKSRMEAAYQSSADSKAREWWFRIIYRFVAKRQKQYQAMLGLPPRIQDVDICALDLSNIDFSGALIEGCIAGDTDFRWTDLRQASFKKTIIANAMFDKASLAGTDFTEADVQSIYVFDEHDRRTSAVLEGRSARQWLFSHGAKVSNQEELNPYHGQLWYEAVREVMRTLSQKMAGTHQDVGLTKGTKLPYREFATKFVDYLISKGVLERVKKSDMNAGWLVKVAPGSRKVVTEFIEEGKMSDVLQPFFDKQLKKLGGTSTDGDGKQAQPAREAKRGGVTQAGPGAAGGGRKGVRRFVGDEVSESGRPGQLPTPVPHRRSGRAEFPHPPRLMVSLRAGRHCVRLAARAAGTA